MLPQDKNPVTALVASAGAGKTTELRRIAKESLDSCTTFDYKGKPAVEKSHLKMVYYAELKNMANCGNVKPSKLLFGGLYKDESDEDEAYQWLLDHQSEAIIYFDGLDQATWSIDKEKRVIKPFEKGSTSQIMYSLLSRKLLPHVKIVLTSRELKVAELPAKARPTEIISLNGLKREDAEKLFIALAKDQGAELWTQIGKLSPRLLNLVSVPVFLVLSAAVMVGDPDKPPPTTITELYNRILMSLCRVENIQKRDHIVEVIEKLKKLAHLGMVEGRVTFTASDLVKFHLSHDDVRDLMIKVPGSNFLSRYLFEGEYIFFFCHQSLQEFLCASFVAQMNSDKFTDFNDKHLHESKWSIVRTFVSGIIYEQRASGQHKVSDRQHKQTIFSKTIQLKIGDGKMGVELLATIYESDNDDLIQSLPSLPFVRYTRLGRDGSHMFSSVWARRGKQTKEAKIDLSYCKLNDDCLDIMAENIKDLKLRVGYLNLLWNSVTAKGLTPFLAHLEVEKLSFDYELIKDFRYENMDWKNIRMIEWKGVDSVQMINEKDVITIQGEWINGCFNKPTRLSNTKLSLRCDALGTYVFDMARFFKHVTFENQVYVKAMHLRTMKDLETQTKISAILLDCGSAKNIDSSLIVSAFKNFRSLISISW